ncbi:glycosyl hydrolase family 18 protein [Curtobacterium sp. 1544]|uniref:chitinase n=1 Tax=Curtobacterium sp. 1544 TaxID=3156417 RepID=UPI00339736AC
MQVVPKLAAVGAGVALLAGAVLLPHTADAASGNLVSNPGFETGTTSGWVCSGASVVSTPVHSGAKAVSGTPTSSDTAQCSQTIAVQPSTSYTLSGWVSGNYVYLGESVSGASTWTSSSGYHQLSTTFTTGASQKSATVYVHGWYGQGTYFADDLTLAGPAGAGGTPTTTPTATPTRTPTPMPTSTPTPTPGTGTGAAAQLPKHTLTGYWQDFDNGAKALRLSDVPTSYDLIAVAFANADPSKPGAVSYSVDPGLSTKLGGYTDAQFTADVATVHARGQKVIVSVGGQNGTISVSDSASAANFAASVDSLMNTFGFDGVDIDLENGVNPTYMAQALHTVAAKHPGMIITMAPQTIDMLSTSSDYFALALNIKDVLTIVQTQYYNSGSMNGCDGGVYAQGSVDFATALACTSLQGGLRADQVGLGFPASTSGAGSGYVAPGVVNNAMTCLAKGTGCGSFVPSAKYPGLRGAMTWSINWDASNGYAFANAVRPVLNALG